MPPNSSYPRHFGSYVLLEPLGSGGMSEVDLARRSVDDAGYVRFLVIKRIRGRLTGDAGFVRMFQDEARINGELQHENIAQVYDFGRVDDEWFLAMEYVAGMDLRRLLRLSLRQGGPVPQRIALRVLADVLQALDYAHARVDTYGRPMNIVHRDVNPRNVMVSFRGEVKLIDFGVAKADTRSEHTQGQTIKGKFAYMAPEQIESATPADGRADLFAVGLMLQEMLEGEHPFSGLSGVQIVHRVLAGDIKPLDAPGDHPDPAMLKAIWRKALAHGREDRYETARAFRDAIEAVAAPLGGLASRAELAAYLRALDPAAADAVGQRLTAFRTSQAPALPPPLPPGTSVASEPAPAPAAPEPTSPADAHSVPPPPQPSRWPLVLAVGAGGAGGALLLSVLLALVIVALPERKATVLAAPKPEQTAPAPRPADPADPADPASAGAAVPDLPATAPGPEPAPEAAAPPPARRRQASGSRRSGASKPATPSTAEQRPPSEPPVPAPEAAPDPPPDAAAPAEATPAEPAPAPPAEAPPAVEMGYLFATSHPQSGLEVLVDGRVVGRTPLRNHELPVGAHTVVIRDPASGQSSSHQATVKKGRPTMIRGAVK